MGIEPIQNKGEYGFRFRKTSNNIDKGICKDMAIVPIREDVKKQPLKNRKKIFD